MKRFLLFLLGTIAGFIGFGFAQQNHFSSLEKSVDSISQHIDVTSTTQGAGGVRDFIINTFYDVVFPIIFGVGLLMAILGIISLLFSDEEADRSKAFKIIGYGIAGIVLIVSARWLTYGMIGESGRSGLLLGDDGNISGMLIAESLYNQIIYPFVKIGFTLMAGVLFIVLLTRVFKMLFNPEEDNATHSMAIIGWNALGILVIIGSKVIVELLYGKRDKIIAKDNTTLGQMGGAIFSDDTAAGGVELAYQIINWVTGLTSLIVLVIIIWQAYQLLMNPEDEEKLSQVSKSIMYVFVGILIIGLSYMIANVFLVQ